MNFPQQPVLIGNNLYGKSLSGPLVYLSNQVALFLGNSTICSPEEHVC